MTAPRHPLLLRLAHALLQKDQARGDGERAVSLRLDAATLPELHHAETPEALAHVALLLEALCASGWVVLKAAPPRAFQTLAERRPVLWLVDADALAAWSGFVPAAPRWSRLLVQALRAQPHGLAVPDAAALLDYLLRSPLPALEGRTPADCAALLDALAADCAALPDAALFTRELSARHFNGHSKVLDARDELLRLLGAGSGRFAEAPVHLLVDVPAGWPGHEVLFIENGVSYERMVGARHTPWAHAALVYAAGFRGGARRLRERAGASLHWRGRVGAMEADRFEGWLHDGAERPAVHFYGDLDFAGLAILAQLRVSFPSCGAWRPGYEALLAHLPRGHTPGQAGKERQQDPGHTGCPFADAVLLPALRQEGRCVDQELWPARSINE